MSVWCFTAQGSSMKQLADDVFVLEGFPPYTINVYLLGEVLIDSSTRWAANRILRRLRGHNVTLHALTHAHPDHQGSSHAICERLGIPLWCGDADADAMEQRGEIIRRMPRHWLSGSVGPLWTGPPHPVARRLRNGDQVGSFTVIESPGHTAGHVSFLARIRPRAGTWRCNRQHEYLHGFANAPGTRAILQSRPGSKPAIGAAAR